MRNLCKLRRKLPHLLSLRRRSLKAQRKRKAQAVKRTLKKY
jgi:hypothetical protein